MIDQGHEDEGVHRIGGQRGNLKKGKEVQQFLKKISGRKNQEPAKGKKKNSQGMGRMTTQKGEKGPVRNQSGQKDKNKTPD